MNRREFTLFIGASLSQIALPALSVKGDKLLADRNVRLTQIRKFWFQNMTQKPEDYLNSKHINQKNFHEINQNELKNEQILNFEGVYFSNCELAILASLAPISV